jgi:hypothetical protein
MLHFAALATSADGEVAVAIAHMGAEGPVLDEVKVMTVTGGEAGVDAVYAGLRAMGIDIRDERRHWRAAGQERDRDVRARAVADALRMAGMQ